MTGVLSASLLEIAPLVVSHEGPNLFETGTND